MPQPNPQQSITIWKHTAYKELLYELASLGVPYELVVEQVRRDYTLAALRICRGNQCRAADLIHMHRNTLAAHLKNGGEK